MRDIIRVITIGVFIISFHLCLFSGAGLIINKFIRSGHPVTDGDVVFFLKSLGALVMSYIVSVIIEEIERSEKRG